MDEKRRAPRIGANLEIFYFSEHQRDEETSRVYYPGTIIDTSKQGIGLLASYPHQTGERLWFEALDNRRHPVAVTVRWIQSAQERYRLGLELLNTS